MTSRWLAARVPAGHSRTRSDRSPGRGKTKPAGRALLEDAAVRLGRVGAPHHGTACRHASGFAPGVAHRLGLSRPGKEGRASLSLKRSAPGLHGSPPRVADSDCRLGWRPVSPTPVRGRQGRLTAQRARHGPPPPGPDQGLGTARCARWPGAAGEPRVASGHGRRANGSAGPTVEGVADEGDAPPTAWGEAAFQE